MLSAICFNLDQANILSSGNGLSKPKYDSAEPCSLKRGLNASAKQYEPMSECISTPIVPFIGLILSQKSPEFNVSAVQLFRKHCGKRRNCS